MHSFESGGLLYYRFEMWPDLTHGIFTRRGGVSESPWNSLNLGGNLGDSPQAVRQNHELIYAALKLNSARACTVWQVHGVDTVVVKGPVRGRRWIARADAMLTDREDVPLVMRYADCTPLLFRDPVQGVIGMAHAGWRGTVSGMAANTVRAMVDIFGCNPSNIEAGIGPSIGPRRYQVGEEVVEAALAYFGTTQGLVTRDPADGTAYFNLWEANRLDLQRVGVERVEIAELCTADNTDQFYSHRAERGRTGRFGVVMSI